ncbi:MAG: hypothetical protein ABJC79_16185, partial [Acidimicrobiia bacterium]
ADHGISFQLGEPARNPSAANLPEVTWTPLLVKYPHQTQAHVDDRRAESIDVLPTVADVLGAKHAGPFDGISLRHLPRTDGTGRMYPWSWRPTARDLVPPDGRGYVDVDGPKGFARVLEARAAPDGTDQALRVYQRGRFGALVGRPVAAFGRGPTGSATATIQHLERFDHVQPKAQNVDWAFSYGGISGVDIETPLAVASNGRIIATTAAQLPTNGTAPFTFLVPPTLLARGRNHLELYVIRGSMPNPALVPVPVRAA